MSGIENILIGYLVYNPSSILDCLEARIDKTYFQNEVRAIIYDTIAKHYAKYRSTTSKIELVQTLESFGLKKELVIEQLTVPEEQLCDASIEWIIDGIIAHKKKFLMSTSIKDAVTAINLGDTKSAEHAFTEAYKSITQLQGTKGKIAHMYEPMEEYADKLGTPTGDKVVFTGYREFDDILRGFKPGYLVVVAARPKTGKSRTMINLIANAIKDGTNVLAFSLEMPRDQYVNLIFSCMTGIPYSRFDDRILTPAEIQKVKDLQQKMQTEYGKLTIVDTVTSVSPSYIAHKIDEVEAQMGVVYNMIAIDHATMMKPDKVTGSDWIDQGSIAEDIRAIGRNGKKVMLTALQLNRGPQQTSSKKAKVDAGDALARSDIWLQTLDVLISIEKPEEVGSTSTLSPMRFNLLSRDSRSGSVELLKDFNVTAIYSMDAQKFVEGSASFWNPNSTKAPDGGTTNEN